MIIPYTHVDAAVDVRDDKFEPLSDEDADVQSWCTYLPTYLGTLT